MLKFKFMGNACGIFTGSNGTRILCDPWLMDGVFEGSWFHYPPIETTPYDVVDVDAIYVSHLHPDHFDERWFGIFRKDMPIIVLNPKGPDFFSKKLRSMGFTTLLRIRDKQTIPFREFKLTMFSAFTPDNFFPASVGKNFLDSALMVECDGVTAFNANDNTPTPDDCDYLLDRFGKVNMAMLNYNAAGPYPACFSNLTTEQKEKANAEMLLRNIEYMATLVNRLKPKSVLPFAGAYVLGGRLSHKNPYLGTTTWDHCATYLRTKIPEDIMVFCLRENTGVEIEPDRMTFNQPYEPIDEGHLKQYLREITIYPYDYDSDPKPDMYALKNELERAAALMQERWKKYGIRSETNVIIKFAWEFSEWECLVNGEGKFGPFLECTIDPRLLRRILYRKSHWNNAEIGCHIEFNRSPNVYEPDLHVGLQFLHL